MGGRLNKRSAWISVLEAGWKNATSLFLKPEKKLERGFRRWCKRKGCGFYIPVLDL